MKEAHRERRRVLLLFSFSILPPIVLLTVLAVVAARNDEAALRYVKEERTRQSASDVSQELGASILRAEGEVLDDLDLHELRTARGRELEALFAEAPKRHPLAARFVAVDLDGQDLIWPDPAAPFLVPGEDVPVLPAHNRYLDENRLAELRTRAGASYRLAESLEEQEQLVQAVEAWEQASRSEEAFRTEDGQPIRILAFLRRAELLLRMGKTAQAGQEAKALADLLVRGDARDEVYQQQWQEFLDRAREVLSDCDLQQDERRLATQQQRILARVKWRLTLERLLLPSLLDEAGKTPTSEIRHHVRVEDAPQVLAYRVIPALAPDAEGGPLTRRGRLLLAIQLDLDRLVQDVLAPVCARLHEEEDLEILILDGKGQALAQAGEVSDAEAGARADLPPVPLWSLRVVGSTAALEEARRNRLMLYGALIGLTLLTAVAGAWATIRYVERSLELAKMKSDFLSNITHELKTPLTSIKMYGELLASGRLKKKPAKRKEYADHIVREGNRLQKLIEDVLDFARQDSGKHDYVLAEEDVADTVTEALDLFRHSAKVRGFDLFVELPPVGQLPPVDLDRDAIARSVLNLLANAVKYSTDERYVKLTVAREEDMIAIAVEDKGIGIDAKDIDQIFDRFYRAGDELTRGVSGAGLGLSLIDQIVQAHGGQIRVASEKGVGSVFTILLPIVEDFREQWPPPDSLDPEDPALLATDEDLVGEESGDLTGSEPPPEGDEVVAEPPESDEVVAESEV